MLGQGRQLHRSLFFRACQENMWRRRSTYSSFFLPTTKCRWRSTRARRDSGKNDRSTISRQRRQARQDTHQQSRSVESSSSSTTTKQQGNARTWSGFASATASRIKNNPSSFLPDILQDPAQRKTLALRGPVFLLLAALLINDETSPYMIDFAQGPSMLPTIHPIGEIYLRETGAWQRILSRIRFGSKAGNEDSIDEGINRIFSPPSYEKGDIIVWRDETRQRYSCKRIIGTAHDQVNRFGQFVRLYAEVEKRPDWGICHAPDHTTFDMEGEREVHRKAQVPANHVWLEGDFPLLSLDSRHYGPIPTDVIRGKVVWRIWPPGRPNRIADRNRPSPITMEEAKLYNLHEVSPTQTNNP